MRFLQLMMTTILAAQLQVENGEMKENTMYNNSEKPFRVHFYIPAKEEVDTIQWQVGKYEGTIKDVQKEKDKYHAYADLPTDTQWKGKLAYTIHGKEWESEYEFCYDTIVPDVNIQFDQEGKKDDILYFFGNVKGSIQGEKCDIQWYCDGQPVKMGDSFQIDQSGLYKVVCTDASQNQKTFEFDVEMEEAKIWMEDHQLCIRDRNFDAKNVECDLLKNPQWIHQKDVHKVDITKGLKDGKYDVQVRYTTKAGKVQAWKEKLIVDTTPPHSIHIQYEDPIQKKDNQVFYASPFQITIQAQDETSDIRKIDWQYGSQQGSAENQDTIQIEMKEEAASKLYIQVQDTMGNIKKYESEETFILDRTAPQVEIQGLESTYYPESIQAVIKVTEANFDSSQVHVFDGEEIEVQWKDNVGTFAIDSEGEHRIRMEYKDGSGNASNADGWMSETKIIDSTPPQLTIDSPLPYQEKDGILYYSKPVEIRTHVKDANPSEIYAILPDKKIKVKESLLLNEDGKYEIQFQTIDAAKNKSDVLSCKTMILDTHISEPSIQMQGKEVKSHIFSSKVKVEADCQDENYENSTMQVLYEDVYGQQKTWQERIQEGKNTISFQKDGKYNCAFHMQDKAGNTVSKSIYFTINQKGSSFLYDPYIEEISNQTLKKINQTLKIQEHNVNQTESQLILLKDGKVIENAKYAKIGNTYHIFTSNFKQDGIYKVRLQTKDEAGHVNHLEKEIYFKIDNTPPEIHIHALYDDLDAVEYRLFDTMGLKKIQVFVDGQEVETIDNLEGFHTYTQELAHKNKKVQIVAMDEAGNENKEQFYVKNIHAKEVKTPDFMPYFVLFAISIAWIIKYKKE